MTQPVIVHHTESDSSHDSESTNGVEWPSLLLMKTHPSPLKDDESEVTIQTTGIVVCHTKNITISKHIPSAPATSHNRKFVLVLHESVGRIEMFWSTNSQSDEESQESGCDGCRIVVSPHKKQVKPKVQQISSHQKWPQPITMQTNVTLLFKYRLQSLGEIRRIQVIRLYTSKNHEKISFSLSLLEFLGVFVF